MNASDDQQKYRSCGSALHSSACGLRRYCKLTLLFNSHHPRSHICMSSRFIARCCFFRCNPLSSSILFDSYSSLLRLPQVKRLLLCQPYPPVLSLICTGYMASRRSAKRGEWRASSCCSSRIMSQCFALHVLLNGSVSLSLRSMHILSRLKLCC